MKRNFDIQNLAIEFVPEIASIFWPTFVTDGNIIYLEFTLSKREVAEMRSKALGREQHSETAITIEQAFGDRTGADRALSPGLSGRAAVDGNRE